MNKKTDHSALLSSIPKGTHVHSHDGWVLMLTADKMWSSKTVSAVVIYGPADQIGSYNDEWCADILYTHQEFPCNDESLKHMTPANQVEKYMDELLTTEDPSTREAWGEVRCYVLDALS